MTYKIYRITWTDDNFSFVKRINIPIYDTAFGSMSGGGVTNKSDAYDQYQEAAGFAGVIGDMFAISPLMVPDDVVAPLPVEFGVPATIVYMSEMAIGMRFIFSGNNYLRISNIEIGSSYYEFTYTIYVNGTNKGSFKLGYTRGSTTKMDAFILVPSIWSNIVMKGYRYSNQSITTNTYSNTCTITRITSSYNAYQNKYELSGTTPISYSGSYSITAAKITAFHQMLEGAAELDSDNPYWDGGTTEEGGGDGGFGDDSDSVTEDDMPTISAVGSGMATIFTPTISQLKALSTVFWGSEWWAALQNTIEGIDKMFVSLGMVPFNVTAGSTVEVTWLGLDITAVNLTLASAQFYEFDMGSIDMSDDTRIYTSGSALDYSPFSRLGIFLPFIGYQELDIDECRGKTIGLKYRIDILSGACVALVSIAGNTIYQFAGNCMSQIPITSQTFENLMTNVVNVGIAAAGVKNSSAIAGGGDAMAEQGSKAMAKRATMYDEVGAIDPSVLSSEGHLANATANAMMGLKPSFNKSGAVSSSASLLTVRQPYLFLTTPRQCLPEHYQRYHGFPSNITDTLNNFSGYTVVDSIRLNDLVATSGEIEEIYSLLHAGVII